MFKKQTEPDPMYALGDRLKARDVEAGYEFLRLFRDRPDIDPSMYDLMRAVALVAADSMLGDRDE